MPRQAGASNQSQGFQTLRFTVQEIANGLAYGVDNFGVPRTVPMSLLPAKSPLPAVGDVWLISKALTGAWMFFAIINAPGPVTVTGNTDDGTGFWHLLQQLDDAGYIVNDVVDDGGGGGSPGPTGPTGPSGPSGTPGASGASGTPGASGGTGSPGPTGPTGPSGPSGTPGASGASGTPGASGGTGSPGPTGPTGPSGPSALPLTTAEGTLASNYTLTGSLATFLTTSSLSVGTWLINFSAQVDQGASVTIEYEANLGTAVGTIFGPKAGEIIGVAGYTVTTSLAFVVVITSAGTIVFQALTNSTGTPSTIRSTTPTSSFTQATGYVAVKIG